MEYNPQLWKIKMFINLFAIILYKYGIFLSKTEGRFSFLQIVTLNQK